MNPIVPIYVNKLPVGNDVGKACTDLAACAQTFLSMANAYALTADPEMLKIASIMYRAAHDIARATQNVGIQLNDLSAKKESPKPPAA